MGTAFQAKGLLPENTLFLDRGDFDLEDVDGIEKRLDQIRPTLIIHTAAHTAVDLAEEESDRGQKSCRLLNTDGPGRMARWCARNGAGFVWFSTDYVFSGDGTHFWEEDDTKRPGNYYGLCKHLGEEAIKHEFQIAGNNTPFIIFRISWVYDATGKNFLNTMLRLASERDELKVVDDQMGTPNYAPHLAIAVAKIATSNRAVESGVYHMSHTGVTNWYSFTNEIVGRSKKFGFKPRVTSIVPVKSAEFKTAAKRPTNSRLCTDKFQRAFGFQLPAWQDGLDAALRQKFKE